jgi:hypothetical protein
MTAFERPMQDARAKGLLGLNSRIGSSTVFATGIHKHEYEHVADFFAP